MCDTTSVDVTYKNGFDLHEGVLTKGSLNQICRYLAKKWKVTVEPERISEGGLIVGGEGYKSVRIRSRTGKWPWIPDELERVSDNYVIFPSLAGATTFFKAFHGAPIWTTNEMVDVKKAFQMFA